NTSPVAIRDLRPASPSLERMMTPQGMVSGCNGSQSPPERSIYTLEQTYRGSRLPVDSALTLTPDASRSAEDDSVERERVFGKSWVCVGYTAQVERPGDILVATVADQPILVTRDRERRLRAFYNVCRHRGSLLVQENGRHDVIRCPYHSWGYSLDGRLLGTPY